MIAHFFIGFLIIVFTSLVLYSLMSIIFKMQFSWSYSLAKSVQKYKLTPLAILLLLGSLYLILFCLTKSHSYNSFINTISPKGAGLGAVGDLINGLITPIISIITIIYLYKAFVQQYQANQMFYNSELEKSYKEDLQWLRNNSEIPRNLESEIKGKDQEELSLYLDPSNNYQIRKTIYILNIFLKLYQTLGTDKRFKHIEDEIVNILISLYLPSLTPIYRDLSDYIINLISENEDTGLDFSKAEVEFLDKFTKLYLAVKHPNEDKLFTLKVNSINELLQQQ